MKIDKIKVYLLEFILLAILSFALFVSNIYNRIILAVLLTICSITIKHLIKKRKVESVHSKKVAMVLAFFAVIYLIAFYLMGLYFGYYKATVVLSLKTILNYIIPIGIIIIAMYDNTIFFKTLLLFFFICISFFEEKFLCTRYANTFKITTSIRKENRYLYFPL